MKSKSIFGGILMFLFYCLPIMAHGDFDELIKELNVEIENDSGNAELFLKRAVLFLNHNEPKMSIQDLKKCKQLGLNSVEVDLNMAKSYKALEKYKKGLAIVDAVLGNNQDHVNALLLKAELLSDLTEYTKSAMYYETAVEKATVNLPENYLAAAAAWEKANNIGQSITVLEKGIADLGELPVFYLKLKEIAEERNRFREAVFYQTKLIEIATRKEKTYYQRALMFMKNNELDKAKTDLDTALELISRLPDQTQNSPATKELKQSIEKTIKFYDYN